MHGYVDVIPIDYIRDFFHRPQALQCHGLLARYAENLSSFLTKFVTDFLVPRSEFSSVSDSLLLRKDFVSCFDDDNNNNINKQ